jgi:hypothetical protein
VNSIVNVTTINFIPPPSKLDPLDLCMVDLPVEQIIELNDLDCTNVDVIRDNGEFVSPMVGVCLNAEPVKSLSDSQLYWSDVNLDIDVPISKVTSCISVWEKELLGDKHESYLLDGLRNGFSIVDDQNYPVSTVRQNYRSTSRLNRSKVEKRLQEEIDKGNYIKTKTKPNNISALGAIPKDLLDVRLVHDMSQPGGGINSLAWDTSVHYTSVDKVTDLIPETGFLAKIDLQAGYRSIPIAKRCYGISGIQWLFSGDNEVSYLFDNYRLVQLRAVRSFRL